jgi:hypothetical protein
MKRRRRKRISTKKTRIHGPKRNGGKIGTGTRSG